MSACSRCRRPVADNAYLCQACTDRLAQHLGQVPTLAEELTITRSRLTRRSTGVGVVSRSSDRPLPWDDRASQVERQLRLVLVSWCRLVVEERGARWPTDTLAAMSRHLLVAVPWLRHHAAAGDVAGDLARATAAAREVIDLVPDRWYAGQCSARAGVDLLDCDCGCHPLPTCQECAPAHADATVGGVECPEEIYVRQGASSVRCRTCGTEHDVEHRRAVLRGAVEDQLATIPELVTALTSIARPIPASTLRSWVARERLTQRGSTVDGVALYRVGDVLDLLAAAPRREAERRPA